jgi:hypothetical protein
MPLGMQKTPLKRNLVLFENDEKLTSGPQEANDLDLKVPMAWQVGYALVLPIIL